MANKNYFADSFIYNWNAIKLIGKEKFIKIVNWDSPRYLRILFI